MKNLKYILPVVIVGLLIAGCASALSVSLPSSVHKGDLLVGSSTNSSLYTLSTGTAGSVLYISPTTGLPAYTATSTLGITGGGGSLSGGTNGFDGQWTSSSALTAGKLIDNGTVLGVNASSSSFTFNLQGNAGVAPLNVASSSGTSLFQVAANGSTTISSLPTGVVYSSSGLLNATNIFSNQVAVGNGTGGVGGSNGLTYSSNTLTIFPHVGNSLAINGQNISPLTTLAIEPLSGSIPLILLDGNSGNPVSLNTSLLSINRAVTFPDSDGTFVLGTGTSGNCAQWSGVVLTSAAAPCGSGGSGNTAFLYGNGLIYNATSTDSVLIGTSTPTTAQFYIQGSGTKNPFNVASSSGASLFQISSGGTVFIGTTTLATASNGVQIQLPSSKPRFSIYDPTGTLILQSTTGSETVAVATSTAQLNLKTGDTAANSQFSLSGNNTNGIGVIGTNGDSTGDGIGFTGTSPNALYLNTLNGANPIQFGTNSVLRMTLDGSGKLGIGTSTPSAALDVKGEAYGEVNNIGTTSTASLAVNLNNGITQTTVLATNTVLSITNAQPGSTLKLFLIQDGGSRTVTYATSAPAIVWPGGTAPTLSTAKGTIDILNFICMTNQCYGVSATGFASSTNIQIP